MALPIISMVLASVSITYSIVALVWNRASRKLKAELTEKRDERNHESDNPGNGGN